MSTRRHHKHHENRIINGKQYLAKPLSVKEVQRRHPERRVWSEENLERVRLGKLDGQDRRCQSIMKHLLGTFDSYTIYKLMRNQFPGCRNHKNMRRIAHHIMLLHCECHGYTDATIADLLEACLYD